MKNVYKMFGNDSYNVLLWTKDDRDLLLITLELSKTLFRCIDPVSLSLKPGMNWEQWRKLFTCIPKSLVFSSLLHMNMPVKVTGLESPKERKAVYKTGTGTRERGHWDACRGTWVPSPHTTVIGRGGPKQAFPGRSGGRGKKAARTHRRACRSLGFWENRLNFHLHLELQLERTPGYPSSLPRYWGRQY